MIVGDGWGFGFFCTHRAFRTKNNTMRFDHEKTVCAFEIIFNLAILALKYSFTRVFGFHVQILQS